MATSGERAQANTIARVVWDTADKYLRSVVEPQEYGDYILPFTVLRRLEGQLAATKDEVIAYVGSLGDMPEHLLDTAVKKKFGLSFYNTSPLDLATIASVDDNVLESLEAYLAGFSNNISDIWTSFDLPRLAKVLDDAGRLYGVVRHFAGIDLSTTSVDNNVMGDVFEDVMYRSFDKKGKAAGAFYTPRDAIHLMVDVLFAGDEESLAGDNVLRTIYDPTAGSGGMLLVARQALRALNPDIRVTLYGQELMASAYALGKADLLIQGGRPDAIRKGDTLMEDLYPNNTFDYVLSNPPFGTDWEVQEKEVRKQAKKAGSRFSHGLPSKNDGQMLFLSHCASKLNPAGGRAAVVSNASPLFNSDRGPNAIRQWLFDEDLIDAIIALPTQMFYGTGIATYVWILDNNKPSERKGKIQLIDATKLWEPMRKPLGDKRRRMSQRNRDEAVRAYDQFADSPISRVMTPQDFMFRDVPVFKQARYTTKVTDEAIEKLSSRRDFTDAHAQIVRSLDGTPWNDLPNNLRNAAKDAGVKMLVPVLDAITTAVAFPDEDADLAVDRRGAPVVTEDWKIVERVPASHDLEEHMATEVLPFAPEAIWDETKASEGNEIPFTRIFYVPEEPRPLEEIDTDIARLMGELTEMFRAVKTND